MLLYPLDVWFLVHPTQMPLKHFSLVGALLSLFAALTVKSPLFTDR
jgi:hypothetical protein